MVSAASDSADPGADQTARACADADDREAGRADSRRPTGAARRDGARSFTTTAAEPAGQVLHSSPEAGGAVTGLVDDRLEPGR